MKDLKLNSNGDLLVENNDFVFVTGEEELRQRVECVLGTNKGEWFNDWEEGINFSNILGKNVTVEDVRGEIISALRQVDETFTLDSLTVEQEGRKLFANFTAHNADGDTVEIINTWE